MSPRRTPKTIPVNARLLDADVRALKAMAKADRRGWHAILREALHAGVEEFSRRRATPQKGVVL